MARNAQNEFLTGQSSRSHATYRISGWLLVGLLVTASVARCSFPTAEPLVNIVMVIQHGCVDDDTVTDSRLDSGRFVVFRSC